MLLYMYSVILIWVDFVYMFLSLIYYGLFSLYRMIVPVERKQIIREILLITGTGHGIGKELAIQTARLGAKVICVDSDQEGNMETVTQIAREGGAAWRFTCDVSDPQQVKALTQQIRETIGEISILINNVGILLGSKPLHQYSTQEIEQIFRVNVLSHIWFINEWIPVFKKNGRGHIVEISSLAGLAGARNLVAYSSTKYAVTGLAEALTEELRYGGQSPEIKVTRVHPYYVNTGLVKNLVTSRFFSVLTASKCAEKIIDGVRAEEEVVYIPGHFRWLHLFLQLFPRKCQQSIRDFISEGADTGSQ